MNRNQLIGYVRSLAFEQGILTTDLINELQIFSIDVIRNILETHINNLESPPSEGTFFSEEFRNTQATSISEILNDLTQILENP